MVSSAAFQRAWVLKESPLPRLGVKAKHSVETYTKFMLI